MEFDDLLKEECPMGQIIDFLQRVLKEEYNEVCIAVPWKRDLV